VRRRRRADRRLEREILNVNAVTHVAPIARNEIGREDADAHTTGRIERNDEFRVVTAESSHLRVVALDVRVDAAERRVSVEALAVVTAVVEDKCWRRCEERYFADDEVRAY